MKQDNHYVLKELEKAMETFKERNSLYGDSYKLQVKVIKLIFPDGIELKEEKDFARFGRFNAVLGKLLRISSSIKNGKGHYDSAHDIMVYAAMLNEVDNEEGK